MSKVRPSWEKYYRLAMQYQFSMSKVRLEIYGGCYNEDIHVSILYE